MSKISSKTLKSCSFNLVLDMKPEVVVTLTSKGSFKGEGKFKADSGLRGL